MKDNHDILRDPVWQFIGVIVSIVATFMEFMTLSSSSQGTILVGITITFIISIIVFARNVAKLRLITAFFFLIGYIGWGLITGLTYRQVPFFTENFGLGAPGVVYAKTSLGFSLLTIEYILFFTIYFLFLYLCIIKKSYSRMIGFTFIFISLLFFLIPGLYMMNFEGTNVLGMDVAWPKTILGVIAYSLYFVGYFLSFITFSTHRKPQKSLSR